MPGTISFMPARLPRLGGEGTGSCGVGPGVADQHRLGRELDSELSLDAVGDLVRESQQLDRGAAAAVGQRERVLVRERDRPRRAVAAREAGALDEPGGGRLRAAVGLRPGGRPGVVSQTLSDPVLEACEVVGLEDRVGEEGAGADGVGVVLVEDHALATAEAEDGLAGFVERRGLARLYVELACQLGVADRLRVGLAVERVGDFEDDPAAGRSLEDARPVREAALPGLEILRRVRVAVVDAHPSDGLAHLLAVGADVLYRRRAHRSGDARQALDPGERLVYAALDEGVPWLAGLDGQGFVLLVDAGGEDPDHGAREAVVGDHDVAAAGEDEQRLPWWVGFANGVYAFLLRVRVDQAGRGAAEPQGRQVGEHAHRGTRMPRRAAARVQRHPSRPTPGPPARP